MAHAVSFELLFFVSFSVYSFFLSNNYTIHFGVITLILITLFVNKKALNSIWNLAHVCCQLAAVTPARIGKI